MSQIIRSETEKTIRFNRIESIDLSAFTESERVVGIHYAIFTCPISIIYEGVYPKSLIDVEYVNGTEKFQEFIICEKRQELFSYIPDLKNKDIPDCEKYILAYNVIKEGEEIQINNKDDNYIMSIY